MMKKEETKNILFLLFSLVIFSCSSIKLITNIENIQEKASPNVLKDIICQYPKSKNVNKKKIFWIRKIIWNDNFNCGLIDVSVANIRGGTYYPYLITREQKYINLTPQNEIVKEFIQNVFNEYKITHIDMFNNEDFIIMDKRLELGIIRLSSSVTSNIFSGNTLEIDSLYSEDLNFEYIINKCSK